MCCARATKASAATDRLADRCLRLLSVDLSFKGQPSNYATHGIHSFAAKFPPQLPRLFIEELTDEGGVVVDPMVGSGTTLVECLLTGRRGVGVDIDPLAVLISRCKTAPIDPLKLLSASEEVCERVLRRTLKYSPLFGQRRKDVWRSLATRFDEKTVEFIKYWFRPETAAELLALAEEIENKDFEDDVKIALRVSLSAIIVTKSGGVSLARDLAHSRPHKDPSKRVPSAITLFKRKVQELARAYAEISKARGEAEVLRGDAKHLPLDNDIADLIVTSPPYAIAIDYVRAHKFSLVWLGFPIKALSKLRGEYIGAEKRPSYTPKTGITTVDEFLRSLIAKDDSRGRAAAKYFADMKEAMAEIYRILKPGRVAIIVVGPSTLRGTVIPTHRLLAEIGSAVGFQCIGYAARQLDRDKRYLPVSSQTKREGIEARIHEEYVIAFTK